MQFIKKIKLNNVFIKRFFSKSKNLYKNRELWQLDKKNPFLEVPEIWVSNLSQIQDFRQSIIKLHPDIFRVVPRFDILHKNITWQTNYQKFQLTKQLTRGEMPGGGAKPWPQKKMGRHHAGSIRAPGWVRGGFAHGIRGPKTLFYMLPDTLRISGLCTALTIKHVQDNLVIINDYLTLNEFDAQFLHDLAEERNWGYSVLFVDINADDIAPNLLKATKNILTFNVMPLYGLNCYSIIKYETLILSLRALYALEQKILFFLHKTGLKNKKYRYIDFKQNFFAENNFEENFICPPFI